MGSSNSTVAQVIKHEVDISLNNISSFDNNVLTTQTAEQIIGGENTETFEVCKGGTFSMTTNQNINMEALLEVSQTEKTKTDLKNSIDSLIDTKMESDLFSPTETETETVKEYAYELSKTLINYVKQYATAFQEATQKVHAKNIKICGAFTAGLNQKVFINSVLYSTLTHSAATRLESTIHDIQKTQVKGGLKTIAEGLEKVINAAVPWDEMERATDKAFESLKCVVNPVACGTNGGGAGSGDGNTETEDGSGILPWVIIIGIVLLVVFLVFMMMRKNGGGNAQPPPGQPYHPYQRPMNPMNPRHPTMYPPR